MLMELMIGLVIGLLTTLAIAVVLSVSEGQRRATMSGEDAQVSGALALHALQRDIRHAGYGFAANPAALGCPIVGQAVGGVAPPTVLAPVTIFLMDERPADTVQLSPAASAACRFLCLLPRTMARADNIYRRSSFSVAANDWLVAVPEVWVSADQ